MSILHMTKRIPELMNIPSTRMSILHTTKRVPELMNTFQHDQIHEMVGCRLDVSGLQVYAGIHW